MLSILIPNRIEPRIHETIGHIEKLYPGCEVIIAADREGRGKGWAIRTALAHAKGDLICFLDGDMDIPPRMIKRLLPLLDDYDIVIGRKQIRGLLTRRILTRLSRLFIWALFGIIIDTQTGIKVFKRDALPKWQTDGFMFDLEILARAHVFGKTIIEIPVDVNIERKVKGSSVLKCFFEALRIRKMLWRL